MRGTKAGLLWDGVWDLNVIPYLDLRFLGESRHFPSRNILHVLNSQGFVWESTGVLQTSCPAFGAAFSPEETWRAAFPMKMCRLLNQPSAFHPFGMFLCFKSLPWWAFSSWFLSLGQVMVMDLFLLLVGQVVLPLGQQCLSHILRFCLAWMSRVREAGDSCTAEEASPKAITVSICLPDFPEHEFFYDFFFFFEQEK